MTQILAFSGRKQSGKSTAAEYIELTIEHLNLPLSYKTYSFADPLKIDICINILGLTYDQCYGSETDKNTMTDLEWEGKKLTAREAMEIIGTDIFRKLKNRVWVDATINKIKKEGMDLAIIPDCRFPNEVDSILENNGYVIRLDRDLFGSQSNSECALDENKYDWMNFSAVIRNQDMTIFEKNDAVHTFLKNKGIFPL
jgi:hypothetical protein